MDDDFLAPPPRGGKVVKQTVERTTKTVERTSRKAAERAHFLRFDGKTAGLPSHPEGGKFMFFANPKYSSPRPCSLAKAIALAALLMVSGLPAQALLAQDPCSDDCQDWAKEIYQQALEAGYSEKTAAFYGDIAYKHCLRTC